MKLTEAKLKKLISQAINEKLSFAHKKPEWHKKPSDLTIARDVIGDKPAPKLRQAVVSMIKSEFPAFELEDYAPNGKFKGYFLKPSNPSIKQHIILKWNPKKFYFYLYYYDLAIKQSPWIDRSGFFISNYVYTAPEPEGRLRIYLENMKEQIEDWTKSW